VSSHSAGFEQDIRSCIETGPNPDIHWPALPRRDSRRNNWFQNGQVSCFLVHSIIGMPQHRLETTPFGNLIIRGKWPAFLTFETLKSMFFPFTRLCFSASVSVSTYVDRLRSERHSISLTHLCLRSQLRCSWESHNQRDTDSVSMPSQEHMGRPS